MLRRSVVPFRSHSAASILANNPKMLIEFLHRGRLVSNLQHLSGLANAKKASFRGSTWRCKHAALKPKLRKRLGYGTLSI